MDIEKKKAELFAILAELDAEIQTISDRIAKRVRIWQTFTRRTMRNDLPRTVTLRRA